MISQQRGSDRPVAAPEKKVAVGPPSAPWGRFPLVELAVLVALVVGAIGIALGGSSGLLLIVIALGLGSLAGLELAVREHFAGYRSHSTLLAGAGGAVTLGVAFLAGLPQLLILAAALVVFSLLFWLVRALFKRRSGGRSF